MTTISEISLSLACVPRVLVLTEMCNSSHCSFSRSIFISIKRSSLDVCVNLKMWTVAVESAQITALIKMLVITAGLDCICTLMGYLFYVFISSMLMIVWFFSIVKSQLIEC